MLFEALVAGMLTGASSTVSTLGLDTDWKQVGKTVWSRSIANFTGSAEVTVAVIHGVLWYVVETPCYRENEKNKRILVWRAGERTATERSCEDVESESDTAEAWESAVGALPKEAEDRRTMPMKPTRPQRWV
jgi:hypothetical protein